MLVCVCVCGRYTGLQDSANVGRTAVAALCNEIKIIKSCVACLSSLRRECNGKKGAFRMWHHFSFY